MDRTPIELEAVLRAHGYMRIERPPELWEPEAYDDTFFTMLGEMIVVGLGRGNDLADLTLKVSNVVVAADDEPEGVASGEFVALTVTGPGDWGPEAIWNRETLTTEGMLASVAYTLEPAGAAFAYVRSFADAGSITVWLRRHQPLRNH